LAISLALACATTRAYVDQDECQVEVHCPLRSCEVECIPGEGVVVEYKPMSEVLAGAIGVLAGWIAAAL
jgi:hypothetical protein